MKVLPGVVFVLVFLLWGCSGEKVPPSEPFQQKESQSLISIEPKKPTRITLKKNASGKYSWELKGEDPSEILEIDSKIRKYIDGNRKNNQQEGGK